MVLKRGNCDFMEERFAEIKGMEKMYAAVPEFSFWGVFYHIMFLQAEIIQNQNIEKNNQSIKYIR